MKHLMAAGIVAVLISLSLGCMRTSVRPTRAFRDAGHPCDEKATLLIDRWYVYRMTMVKVDGERMAPKFDMNFQVSRWLIEMLPGRHHVEAEGGWHLETEPRWSRPIVFSGDFVAESGKNYYLRVNIVGSATESTLHMSGVDIVELPPGCDLGDTLYPEPTAAEAIRQCPPVARLQVSD